MALYRIDPQWTEYTHVDEASVVAMANDGYGVHGEGVNSLVPLVPVVPCEHGNYAPHQITVVFYSNRVEGNDIDVTTCPGTAVRKDKT